MENSGLTYKSSIHLPIHLSINPSIHPSIQQIFVKHPQHARPSPTRSRQWKGSLAWSLSCVEVVMLKVYGVYNTHHWLSCLWILSRIRACGKIGNIFRKHKVRNVFLKTTIYLSIKKAFHSSNNVPRTLFLNWQIQLYVFITHILEYIYIVKWLNLAN